MPRFTAESRPSLPIVEELQEDQKSESLNEGGNMATGWKNMSDSDRKKMVWQEVEQANQGLSKEDRKSKYNKMRVSPYAFYRGTNHLFWKDFIDDVRLSTYGGEAGRTWIQGDMHAYNFGTFCNDRREIVYDVNDFDDSIIADFQYDVWRLGISLILINHENSDIAEEDHPEIVEAYAKEYLKTMVSFVENNEEIELYFSERTASGLLKKFIKQVDQTYSQKRMLKKWAFRGVNPGELIFKHEKDKLIPLGYDDATRIKRAMTEYRRTLTSPLKDEPFYFQLQSAAKRLNAGTGSLGTPRYYLMLAGPSFDSWKDNVILDVKEQLYPTAYAYLCETEREALSNVYPNPAQLHAAAYEALTKHTDDYLGWMRVFRGDYSVRERSPYKESFPAIENQDPAEDFPDVLLQTTSRFAKQSQQWGRILATAHARGNLDLPEPWKNVPLKVHLKNLTHNRPNEFVKLVRKVAVSYAKQVEADWKTFCSHT